MTNPSTIAATLHASVRMGARLLVFLATLGLASCGVSDGQFRLSGTYEGQKQADFLLISPDGGLDHVDTLHIRNNDFDYRCDLTDDATFCIIYPGNTAPLIIWAHSGDHIELEGQNNDLWHVKVEGNDENELYNEFRQQTQAGDTLSLRRVAATVIRQHPESAVSAYLLTQYFILPDGLPTDSVQQLYEVIRAAQPQNVNVIALGGQLAQKNLVAKGSKMQKFDLKCDDGQHHTLPSYQGKTLVMYFWAGWQGNCYTLHSELTRLRQEQADKGKDNIRLLSYSLDLDSISLRVNKPNDINLAPTYCDMKGFESPLVKALGIHDLPYIIIIGPDGRIQATDNNASAVRQRLSQ